MVYFSFSISDVGSSANATATFPGLQPGSETKIIQPGPNLIVIRLPRITTVPPPTTPGPSTTPVGPPTTPGPTGKPLFSQISGNSIVYRNREYCDGKASLYDGSPSNMVL